MATLLLDIGGTYVKYNYIDNRFNKVGAFPVKDINGVENIPEAIEKFIHNYELDQIGISAPAPFDYTNGIGHMEHKLLSLNNFSLRDFFLKRYPKAKIVFIHDAVAFMLGALEEFPQLKNKKAACVMLGTGLGYAFSDQGKIWVNDSETSMPELGFSKYKDGIVEDYVSATALLNIAKKEGYNFRYVKEMSDAALKDSKIKDIFYRVGVTLGEVLNARSKIDLFNVVVIGGGVSRAWDLLKDGFKSVSSLKCLIVKSSLDCPIIGVKQALKLGKDNIYLKK